MYAALNIRSKATNKNIKLVSLSKGRECENQKKKNLAVI